MTARRSVPTIHGGTVPIDAIVRLSRPASVEGGEGWAIHVDLLGGVAAHLGPFPSAELAYGWLVDEFPFTAEAT